MVSLCADKSADRSSVLEFLAFASAVLLTILLLTFRAASEGISEQGDGVQHYMIARFSWLHPELFVHHWGKPLFTVLSSPFAQYGYAGMTGFNVVCALVTSFFAIKLLRHVGGVAQLAFPILLLLSPQYAQLIMNGMTEVLFGMLTMVTVYLLFKEKFVWAVIVASFTPFARPEYALFVPMVLLWVAYCKQWKAIPFVVFGLVVYALIGGVLLGDPLWYWHSDPYKLQNDTYGSGDLFHFWNNADHIFGRPLLWLGVVACLTWPVLFWSQKEARHQLLFIVALCAIPVFATFALHSLIWWKGTFGSAGLLRVIATVVPLAVLFTLYVVVNAARQLIALEWVRRTVGVSALALLTCWCWSGLMAEVQVPLQADKEQLMLDATGARVRSRLKDGERVHSTHPYIAFRTGLDQFDKTKYISQYGFPLGDGESWSTRIGDLMVWENKFGPNECRIPINDLLADHRFTLLDVFVSNGSYRTLDHGAQEAFIFRRENTNRWVEHDTIWSTSYAEPGLKPRIDAVSNVTTDVNTLRLLPTEFPFELRGIGVPREGTLFDNIKVDIDLDWTGDPEQKPLLVFSQEEFGGAVRYEPLTMQKGKFSISYRSVPQLGDPVLVLYIYNVPKVDIAINSLLVTRERWMQQVN